MAAVFFPQRSGAGARDPCSAALHFQRPPEVAMRTLLPVLLAALLWPATGQAGGELGKKDLERLQGTWTFESYEEGAKKTLPAELKDKRIFFGANQFIISKGEELLQVGTVKLDSTDGHRDVDAAILAGPHKGDTMLGIYRLDGDKLTVCFDPEGNDRPEGFKTRKNSKFFLAVYQRVVRPGEELNITGNYKSESTQLNGEKQTADAEIRRIGDSYLLSWKKGILDAYVGVGIRKGNVLSVCWGNKGQVGVCVYQIQQGPRLEGEWTILGGPGLLSKEILTSKKSK
jgi:uncharacterized protein (TIGR03067 family)